MRPGSIRALSRGLSGRRGRSIRMQARIWTIIVFLIIIVSSCVFTL